MAEKLPKWISLKEACEISGHDKTRSLAKWIERWNREHLPVEQVKRRVGKIEQHSLVRALDLAAKKFESRVQESKGARVVRETLRRSGARA